MQKSEDSRNLVDKYKGLPLEEIVADLDKNGIKLEIALDNVSRDFNMGTIVRSANAFGVRKIYVIGRRQWNKRGAMATDKYLHVEYFADENDFLAHAKNGGKKLIAIDNTEKSKPISKADLPENAILIFGAERDGIRAEILDFADEIVEIEQFGSTRSMNVGVAAGIAMYQWVLRNVLK